ncbi:phage tail protein [Roseomonas populi]|uniref:Phage tail protein n=1 Tax=Roseomonas populi TaxID=3121582 RepID=A0ABT1X3S5_9PROT|nr:phage tail protein [Roseomonas pecuniae]MCR0982748.1 phage tail protein [Roseomonas pecuniae]
MPPVLATTTPADPYKNFKFLVLWDQRTVAAVSKVTGLKRVTEVVRHRSGGDPSSSRKSPGRTEYEPVTLERGVTFDTAFDQWASAVWAFQAGLGRESSPANFRKTVTIELYNDAGQAVQRYFLYRCWVSEYTPLPELDANANGIAIQSIKLENEGWKRDEALTPPVEPSFSFQP